MNKQRLILVLAVALILIGTVTAFVLGGRTAPVASPSPSPVPSADPLSEDRALLTQLSTELAVKFRNFEKVDQAYVDSIRPYLTKQFFEDYRSTLRYADRAPFLQPVRSVAESTTVAAGPTEGTATATVKLRSTYLRTKERFEQTIRIDWQRSGDRWSATNVYATRIGEER